MWVVESLVDNIDITWSEVQKALLLTGANPIELEILKKGFEYATGGKDDIKVGALVTKMKSLFK